MSGFGTLQVRICEACGRQWNLSDHYAVCGVCGGDAPLEAIERTGPYHRAPTFIESEQVISAQRKQAADILERTIQAATAALRFDINAWLGPEGEAWTGGTQHA